MPSARSIWNHLHVCPSRTQFCSHRNSSCAVLLFSWPLFFSQQQQKFMARDRSKSSSMCSAMLLASLPQKKLRLLFLLFPSSAFLLVHCNRQNRFPLFPFSSLLQKHSNVFSFHFFLSSPPDSSDCSACVGAAAAARASTPLSW